MVRPVRVFNLANDEVDTPAGGGWSGEGPDRREIPAITSRSRVGSVGSLAARAFARCSGDPVYLGLIPTSARAESAGNTIQSFATPPPRSSTAPSAASR
jgi:hypothetical protein